MPLFERKMIFDLYSNRAGKGTHAANHARCANRNNNTPTNANNNIGFRCVRGIREGAGGTSSGRSARVHGLPQCPERKPTGRSLFRGVWTGKRISRSHRGW